MDSSDLATPDVKIEARIPTWVAGLLGGLLCWSLISDVLANLSTGDPGSALWWLLILKVFLDHASVALAGLKPYAAAVLIWCALPITIYTGYVGLTSAALAVVTVAVVALCTRRWVTAHLIIAFVAAVAQPMASHGSFTFWTNLLVLVPAIAVGGVVRYFLLRAAGERERVRTATQTVERVREQERLALSRELHDAVSSGLALISMETASVEDSDDPEELRDALETVQQVARSTSAELRLLVRTLRDPDATVDAVPLATDHCEGTLAAVTSQVTRPLEERGFAVSTDFAGLGETATDCVVPTVLHTYLRIAQEAVTNVIKHAPEHAKCRVKAGVDGEALHFTLSNAVSSHSGSARRAGADSGGVGLKSIQERVTLTSGVVSYGRRDNDWVVEATLPMSGTAANPAV